MTERELELFIDPRGNRVTAFVTRQLVEGRGLLHHRESQGAPCLQCNLGTGQWTDLKSVWSRSLRRCIPAE